MGVPGFYSWLTKRYPIIKQVIGEHDLPHIDNLYLDMNGIIYRCVKDEEIIFKAQVVPKEFEKIWEDVFNYISNIVNMLKPGKMVLLALDGVAPRSKMNNQRARRFRSAKDHRRYMDKFMECWGGNQLPDAESFKNNSISPGTAFMERLNHALHTFVERKMVEDANWRRLNVIFTGSDCPGEGQHKIMEFIRANNQLFSPTDTHCLYGADADLIMLSMTLPMRNICIIREEFTPTAKAVHISNTRKEKVVVFEMILISILREYFELQYSSLRQQMKSINYDIDRICKDFVLLFFFIGNDFLPRCYAFNIREREIQDLIASFKRFLVNTDAYVVSDDRTLNLAALAKLTYEISASELEFIQRNANETIDAVSKLGTEDMSKRTAELQKQSQFMQVMKGLYSKQEKLHCSKFYAEKFGFDPKENPQAMLELLQQYTYGLKFVFEYYYVNLPSWSWYYPYYYAPLLSDLTEYLSYVLTNSIELKPFDLDRPFDPFKQLLCIMPKESYELLPVNFQHLLVNPESPLRKPIDYYPDQFDQDPFGSIREHEAIPLIPFLDHKKINEAFDQVINDTPEEDRSRNMLTQSKLYLCQKGNGKFINVSFKLVNLLEKVPLPVNERRLQTSPMRMSSKNLFNMPTLEMMPYKVIFQNQKITVQPEPAQDQRYKLGDQVYFGYPFEAVGRIQAFIDEKHVFGVKEFSPYNYRLDEIIDPEFAEYEQVQKQTLRTFLCLKEFIKKKMRYIDFMNEKELVFIMVSSSFVRTLQGQFKRFYSPSVSRYEIVPKSLLKKERFYTHTRSLIIYPDLKSEFPINSEVLITNKTQLCGSRAKVVGYDDKHHQVKIEVIERINRVKPEMLNRFVNTDEIYFELKFVSKMLNLRQDILLTMMGSVEIAMSPNSGFPPSVDIGLNFINRYDKLLVANLVRIDFRAGKAATAEIPEERMFKFMDISLRAFELVLEYKEKFGAVFQFIMSRHERLIEESKFSRKKINWREVITPQLIFPSTGCSEGDTPSKKLMRVYIWLISKPETHLPLLSIYSKQVSVSKILKMQSYFKKVEEESREPKGGNEKTLVNLINPNMLFSAQLSRQGFLHLKRQPDEHFIRDEVVCLKPEFFGDYGIVVGVDQNEYEVLFAKTSIGKTNLRGLCDNLRGGRFKFRELLNLANWSQHFEDRRKSATEFESLGWTGIDTDTIKPTFQSKPIRRFNDFDVLVKSLHVKDMFPEIIVKFIQEARAQAGRIEVEQGFTLVDNAEGDYDYRYDQKKVSIPIEQVEELEKQKKWVQKETIEVRKSVSSEFLDAGEDRIEPEKIVGKEIGDQEDSIELLEN